MSFNARAGGAITLDKLRIRLSCGWFSGFRRSRRPAAPWLGPSSPLGAHSAATRPALASQSRPVGKWIPVGARGRQGGSFTAPGPRAPGASIPPTPTPTPRCAPRVVRGRPISSGCILPELPVAFPRPCPLRPWCNLSESQRPKRNPGERSWRKTQPGGAAQARPGEVTTFVPAHS